MTLAQVDGVGSVTLTHWYKTFGTFCNLWTASVTEVERGVGRSRPKVVNRILEMRRRGPGRAESRVITPYGEMWVLTLLDPAYPARLRLLADPPWTLYGVGDVESLSGDVPALAVVGTRRSTICGRQVARAWSADLAARGVVIVSGLARGIDGMAHRGALDGGGRTVAVLAGGLRHVYPPEHRDLARQVAEHGSVITEYPPERLPHPGLFHVRNRIVSGLTDGVLVVEAGERSGALITVSHALDQGRDVFAVPGSVTSPASRGANRLIQEGAKAVLDPEDILVEFPRWPLKELPARSSLEEDGRRASDDGEARVLAAMEEGHRTPDLIVGRTGLRREEVSRILTDLELAGRVLCQPGGLYAVVPFSGR